MLPPFEIFPELRSDRISLNEMKLEHLEHVREMLYYDGEPAHNDAAAMAMIKRIEGDYQAGSTVNWLIIDLATQEPIGSIGYYRGFEEMVGEIGFVLKEQFHGKGYMSEALKLVVEFGEKTLDLDRIIAITKPENKPAIRLLERGGFRYIEVFEEVYVEYEYQTIELRQAQF